MHTLFTSLLWPAAAGNVAWSFFVVLLDTGLGPWERLGRLLVLCLIAAYLIMNWMRTQSVVQNSMSYWLADGFHLATLAATAIAIQSRHPWEGILLLIMFLGSAAGHFVGAWESDNPQDKEDGKYLALVSAIAAAVLGWLLYQQGPPEIWVLPLVSAFAFLGWLVVRYWYLPELHRKEPPEPAPGTAQQEEG